VDIFLDFFTLKKTQLSLDAMLSEIYLFIYLFIIIIIVVVIFLFFFLLYNQILLLKHYKII
jgi:hypothetical protein